MGSLKESAQAYTPKQTFNIADLDRTNLKWQIIQKTGTTTRKSPEGEDVEVEYTYNVMVFNEQEYRVPNTVLEEIQKMLKLKPDLEFVNVTSTGSGLSTRYKVEAIMDELSNVDTEEAGINSDGSI
jgi:NurA-like 5'-3' nuclease